MIKEAILLEIQNYCVQHKLPFELRNYGFRHMDEDFVSLVVEEETAYYYLHTNDFLQKRLEFSDPNLMNTLKQALAEYKHTELRPFG